MSARDWRFNISAWLGALALIGGGVALLSWVSLQAPETRAHDFYGIFVLGLVILLALSAAFALLLATPLFWAATLFLARASVARPAQDAIAGALSATIAFVASPILYMQSYAPTGQQIAQCAIAALLGACAGALYWALDVRPWARARLRA